jgi:hypothetical protein
MPSPAGTAVAAGLASRAAAPFSPAGGGSMGGSAARVAVDSGTVEVALREGRWDIGTERAASGEGGLLATAPAASRKGIRTLCGRSRRALERSGPRRRRGYS